MRKLLIVVISILTVAGLATGIYGYISSDRVAPKITLADVKITYTKGDPESKLMVGLSANDSKDGDISDDIFIEKIIVTGTDTAVVYYGVEDSSHNATIASRTITYIVPEEDVEPVIEEVEVQIEK